MLHHFSPNNTEQYVENYYDLVETVSVVLIEKLRSKSPKTKSYVQVNEINKDQEITRYYTAFKSDGLAPIN